jgi:hypothetical protein
MRYTLKYIEYLAKRIRFHVVSDRRYRVERFIKDFHQQPNLTSPKTFNEKIMYRMLADRNPLFTELADKLRMRDTVTRKVGEEYLVPLLGVYQHVNDIDLDVLPEQFVLKCNHDCGSVIICNDKKKFNFRMAKKKLTFCLKRNMYYSSREWQYKEIEPYILCEKYLKTLKGDNEFIADIYRTHCFNGIPTYIEVEYHNKSGEKYGAIYDQNGCLQPFIISGPLIPVNLPVPSCFKEMLSVAGTLTSGLDYCRADFYIVDDRPYFSEFTFAPANGREKFFPLAMDEQFGLLWNLPGLNSAFTGCDGK